MDILFNKEAGDRIKEIRSNLKFTQESFAKKLEVSKSFVAQIEGGFQQPSAMFLIQLFKTFNVSIDWLFSGRGQMFILPENHYLNKLDDKTIQILGLIEEKLSEEEKLHFWDSVRSILRAILAGKQQ